MRFATLDEWLVWQEQLHPKAIDLGLNRVRNVYERLGLNQGRAPYTFTIGGTNGKGSCVAFLDAMLRAQGYRVGTYTSPHLLRYNERIRIDGEPVGDAAICEAFARIDEARGDISLSFFEFGTLAALDVFRRADLDIRVLEVGLGGRLDAVNLIDADAALVATIDLDHREYLGDTREEIALEKAGIFRSGRPAVVGDPKPPANLLRFAAERALDLSIVQRDFGPAGGEAGSWDWHGAGGELRSLPIPAIPGDHQLINASAVIQLLRLAGDDCPVSERAIRDGLVSVRLQGRFQRIHGSPEVLLDVAHNPQSVQALASHLQTHFADRRVHAVFSIMRDKDIPAVIAPMRDRVHHWYLAPLNMARAAAEDELRRHLAQAGVDAVSGGFPNASAAIAAARGAAAPGDLVVVFGSFFLVSEFLAQASRIEV